MVRVKITGEVTEVDREVMKALRAEEKRIRRALRSNEGTVKDGIAHQTRTFSLSAVSENELEKSDWLVDPTSDFANVEARLFVESAMEMLSPLEQEIFSSCLLGEMPIRQFAERNGMRKSTALSRCAKYSASAQRPATASCGKAKSVVSKSAEPIVFRRLIFSRFSASVAEKQSRRKA